MRSQGNYILTKDEVYGTALAWLAAAFQLEVASRKCDASTLWRVLLMMAARAVSFAAACRDANWGVSRETLRKAFANSLPSLSEVEHQLNQALATRLPQGFTRKPRIIAIDLTMIPYYGGPLHDENEIYRGKSKAGTSSFHAYATAVIVNKGQRFTVAATYVPNREKMHDVVDRLLQRIAQLNIKIKFLLLDKGFFSFQVMHYLQQVRCGYIIPVALRGARGRRRKATGLRALVKKNNGYYSHTLEKIIDKQLHKLTIRICLAGKGYAYKKTGQRRYKKLSFAISGVRRNPRAITELYRKRFGIETSYRQANQARGRTCSPCPATRLLYIGIALVLRNVWAWFHHQLCRRQWTEEPIEFQELMRFKQMLLWITEVILESLGANPSRGIERQRYEELMARKTAKAGVGNY
jgi:hypothetical protein